MKPVISPVQGAFVFLCADGVYTEAPLYVGPFDCGFVRNPKGEGYLRLRYMGETSVAGVTYSGVHGAVLAKAKFGNHTVVTPVGGKPAPQVDYPQVDWSKESPGDAGKVRDSLSRVCNIARLCTVDPAVGVDNVLATSRRIDDLLYEARNARYACDRIIGSYRKKAKLGKGTVVTPVEGKPAPQVDRSKENQGDAEEARPQPAIREALCVDSAAKICWHLNCAARISMQYTARPADDPEGVLAAIGRIEIHTSTIRALCHKMIGSYQKGG